MWEQEGKFTTVEPKIEDLVGTWVPTPETLDYMRDAGGYQISQHEIILREDGSFSIINMPDWWDDGFGHSSQGFVSFDGEWWPEDYYGEYLLGLHAGNTMYHTVHFQNNQAPYRIFIGVGDPDLGGYMIFVRQGDT